MSRVNLALAAGVILVSSIGAATWRRRVDDAAWPVPAPRPRGPVPVPLPEPPPASLPVPPQVAPQPPSSPRPPQPRRGMRLLPGAGELEELLAGREDAWW